MGNALSRVRDYLSLVKFSHTVFALPFALIGFTLALASLHHPFQWALLAKMLLCMVFARSAAMSFNRYLDRHYDALNPRTAAREIPSGVIKAGHALLFTIINSLLFIATTWFINPAVFLSFFCGAVHHPVLQLYQTVYGTVPLSAGGLGSPSRPSAHTWP